MQWVSQGIVQNEERRRRGEALPAEGAMHRWRRVIRQGQLQDGQLWQAAQGRRRQ